MQMQKQTWLTSIPVPRTPLPWSGDAPDSTWQLVSDVFKEQADAVSLFHSINISIIAKVTDRKKVKNNNNPCSKFSLFCAQQKHQRRRCRGVRVVNFGASHTVDSPHDDDDDDDVVHNHYIFMLLPLRSCGKTLPFSKDKDKFSLCICLCLC